VNLALLRQERILEKVKTHEEIVLDIGCGGGYLISRLSEKCDFLVGLDVSARATSEGFYQM
jgi:predicted TPR repeat methyltransferase